MNSSELLYVTSKVPSPPFCCLFYSRKYRFLKEEKGDAACKARVSFQTRVTEKHHSAFDPAHVSRFGLAVRR